MSIDDFRERALAQAQGAVVLQIAYIGIVNHLLTKLAELGGASAEELAAAAGKDAGYVARWCDAAFAFELLDEVEPGRFALTGYGDAFRPDLPGTLMPIAVHVALAAHMAERAAELCASGEQPGEAVLAERRTILPWFGPMLEAQFGPMLDREVIPAVAAFAELGSRGGLVVDLGCGNGWYLRRLAARFPRLRGVGLDGFDENIRQARDAARLEGLSDRLEFAAGDLHHFRSEAPADLIAMNRALHHVWSEKDNLFRILREHLAPGGCVVFWEPCWPAERELLRQPARRVLAFQNLAEHVQGNRFLRPDEIADELHRAGMSAEIHVLAEGREAVVVGRP